MATGSAPMARMRTSSADVPGHRRSPVVRMRMAPRAIMKMVPCPRPRVPNQLVSGETEKSVASSAMTADAVTPATVTWRTRSIARMRSNKPGPPSGCETPGIRRRTGAPRHARTAMASTRSVLTGSKVLSTPGSTMTGTAPRSRPSSATATQIPFPVNGYGDCQCTVERKLGVVPRISVTELSGTHWKPRRHPNTKQ